MVIGEKIHQWTSCDTWLWLLRDGQHNTGWWLKCPCLISYLNKLHVISTRGNLCHKMCLPDLQSLWIRIEPDRTYKCLYVDIVSLCDTVASSSSNKVCVCVAIADCPVPVFRMIRYMSCHCPIYFNPISCRWSIIWFLELVYADRHTIQNSYKTLNASLEWQIVPSLTQIYDANNATIEYISSVLMESQLSRTIYLCRHISSKKFQVKGKTWNYLEEMIFIVHQAMQSRLYNSKLLTVRFTLWWTSFSTFEIIGQVMWYMMWCDVMPCYMWYDI